jgi:uncharacterized protein (TIGR02453 family)
VTAPRFTPRTLSFLRRLKRNNRREWFNAHRDEYERDVRAPMIAVIERLAVDFRSFAPHLVASPTRSLYRIYRDIRFSEDKKPYKTHVAAVFPCRDLPKHEGAGLYFHAAPDGVWVGGGMYAPQMPQLQAVREHIAANSRRLRTIVSAPGFRRAVGSLEGERLQRVPRGFPKDHEAAEFLKYRQFLAGRDFPATFAASLKFYSRLIDVFRQITPLVNYLNEPLLKSARGPGRAGRSGRSGGGADGSGG